MSKIIQAVNVMISKKDKITDVFQSGNELYFLYEKKYKWSIIHENEPDDYLLYFYKTEATIEELTSQQPDLEVSHVCYRAKDIGTKEAFGTFRDLYLTLTEKVLGIDEVLDDIIEEDVPF